MEEDMNSMPVIRMKKPSRMLPTPFFLLLLQNMDRTMPTKARMGPKELGFSILTQKLSP